MTQEWQGPHLESDLKASLLPFQGGVWPNILLRKNILAGMFGFEEKEYFEAKESSSEVPEVSFE